MIALFVLASAAAAMNICHPDCLPFHCHGPLDSHCSRCSGNKTVLQGKCVCQLGYFDHGGKECSVFSQDCLQADISLDGTVSCTKCARLVYTRLMQQRTPRWKVRVQAVDVLRAWRCLCERLVLDFGFNVQRSRMSVNS
jgi:hypothetical protein